MMLKQLVRQNSDPLGHYLMMNLFSIIIAINKQSWGRSNYLRECDCAIDWYVGRRKA